MMKRFWEILSVCIGMSIGSMVAQTGFDRQTRTIVDALQEPVPGKGTVIIRQPEGLKKMIGVSPYSEMPDSTAFMKIQGYRTQVFSGNDQRRAKDEAFSKEQAIKELFPDIPTYVTYNAPFWRLRVGDFRSHEEAYRMQRLLMTAFPEYRKEMYIVKEEIKVPLY